MIRLTLLALLAVAAFAQHMNTMNPVRPMPAPVNAFPYGNILFPGGIPSTHASRLGATIAGSAYPYGGGVIANPGVRRGPGGVGPIGRNRTVVVPYAVPVFTGGYYGYQDYGYAAAAPQNPNVTVVVPQQPAPSVVINHNYSPQEPGQPVLKDYSKTELPEPSNFRVYEGPKPPKAAPEAVAPAAPVEKPQNILLAFKNGVIRQAIGFWLRDATLRFVTPEGSMEEVAIDTLDKDTTSRLNAERNMPVNLNPPKK